MNNRFLLSVLLKLALLTLLTWGCSLAVIDDSQVQFSYGDLSVTAGTPKQSSAPTWVGTVPSDVSYAITARPNGASADNIVIDTSTGKLSANSDAAVSESGTYIVTATIGPNDPVLTEGKTFTATIKITVKMTASAFSYTDLLVPSGKETSSSAPVWTGTVPSDVSYAITARPNGASADNIVIDTSTGKLRANSNAAESESGSYTVTATIGPSDPVLTAGTTFTATITITVNKMIASAFSYSDLLVISGSETSSSAPAWTGTSPNDVSYAITARPHGASTDNIVIDTLTGIITIKNSADSLDSGEYTVTATIGPDDPTYTQGSVQTASISLTVNKTDQLPDLGYTGELTMITGTEAQSSVPVWALNAPTDISYAITIRPNGAVSDNITIDPSTGELTITNKATIADGGSYTVTATIGNDDPTYVAGIVSTVVIKIRVYVSFTVTFSYTDLAISSGSEASSSTPAWTGTAPSDVSYAITAIPNGASADNTVIDTSTGIITITNSATSLDSGGYLISATIGPNDPNYFPGSVQTASISFSVSKIDQLPNLSFPGITAVAGEDTQSSVPAWGQDAPSDVSYTLTASPNGATAGNIAVSAISGRVATTRSTTPADSGDYTLSATIGANDPRYKAGLVQTANIAISISKSDRVPHFVYGALQRGDVSNDEIHVLPNWNFSAPTDITYSITSTPLSSTDGHVSIDASSGKVTLTAQASKSDDGNYTVTATIGDNDPLYQSSSRTAVVTVETYGSFSSTFRYDSDITVVSKEVVSSSAPIWTGTEPTDVTYQIWPSPYGKISIDSNGVITTSDTLTTADSRLYTIIATIGNNDQNFKANSAQLTEINLIVTGRSIPSFSYSALTVTAGTSISYHSPRWPTWPEKDRQPSDITYTIVERPPTATEGHITIYSTSGHLFATTDVRSLDAGTYKVRATVGNTDTMYIHGEEHTASIEVYVNKTSHLPTFNFDDLAADSGTQQQSSPPTWNSAAPVDVSYSITARPDNAVAAHVSIDTATGVITLESNATSTDNGEYTVTARIGSNDTLYANDSSKTAQIKVMVSTDNQLPYFNYSVIRRAMVATNTVMSSPAWAINPPSDVSYAITSKPANSTGGLTIDTDSGELTLEGHATSGDGGSYTVTATVGSNDPKYPPAISQTTTITVDLYKTAPKGFGYGSNASLVLPPGEKKSFTPTWIGIAPTSVYYDIVGRPAGVEALGGDVEVDSSSGVLTVSVYATSEDSGIYTIRAYIGDNDPIYESAATLTTSIDITFNKKDPPTFYYLDFFVTAGVPETSAAPQWEDLSTSPQDVYYTIEGMSQSATEGHISISPKGGWLSNIKEATKLDSGQYTIRATIGYNDPVYIAGKSVTAIVNVSVSMSSQLPSFNIDNVETQAGTEAQSSLPTWGYPPPEQLSYSITARPEGVSPDNVTIDESTGKITISSNATSTDSGVYTVTAKTKYWDPVYYANRTKSTDVQVTIR